MATLVSPNLPDERGRYGPYGGRYVPETLMALLDDLEMALRQGEETPAVVGISHADAGLAVICQ